MHETSIAAEIHRACRAEIDGRGGGRLESVRVQVGELTAVEPDLLRFAWRAVVAGTPDEGARLDVEWCPARHLCAACGEITERQPGTWLVPCPLCGAPLSREGGDELDVRDVTFRRPAHEEEEVSA